ncbi:MAG: S-layer homology domain-containing protein, partial [Actinobacteria bacterium]|nr:S-layer homology domain-containing protein [Actinomycetota bacterium]
GGPQPVGAAVPGRWDHVVDWAPVPDLVGTVCPPGSVPAAGFVDAVGTAHERGIDCAVHLGVAFGRDATTFAPGAPVDRAQLASFVARTLELAGVELPAPEMPAFDDLGDSVHAERIEQLAALGVVAGVGERRFEPARPVTRAQLATFLVNAHRIAGGEPLPAMPDAFVDDAGTHERAIDAAAAAGLLAGLDEQRFGPAGQVQRGQMASALSRLLDRLARDGRLTVATTG